MSVNKCIVGWCGSGGPCYCCLATKPAIIALSVVSLLATAADAMFDDGCACRCTARDHVRGLRLYLRALFQAANLLLILASLLESAPLMQVYVWYTMAFLVAGFAAALTDTLLSVRRARSRKWCALNFLSEIAFLFVLSRCLPLVDMYRKDLVGGGATPGPKL